MPKYFWKLFFLLNPSWPTQICVPYSYKLHADLISKRFDGWGNKTAKAHYISAFLFISWSPRYFFNHVVKPSLILRSPRSFVASSREAKGPRTSFYHSCGHKVFLRSKGNVFHDPQFVVANETKRVLNCLVVRLVTLHFAICREKYQQLRFCYGLIKRGH